MQVKETVIRRMTRLAAAHGAVNLAQGLPMRRRPGDMVWSGVAALLGGTEEGARRAEFDDRARSPGRERGCDRVRGRRCRGARPLREELFERWRGSRDELNQYSYPFGLPELRHAIADYTQACHGYRPDPDEQITVVLGASEAWPRRSVRCSRPVTAWW